MDIKELIQFEYGIELPISGGYGDRIETAVKIDSNAILSYIDIQNNYMSCWWNKNKWKKVEQTLVLFDDKKFDKITIKFMDNDGVETLLDYFFDITDCV